MDDKVRRANFYVCRETFASQAACVTILPSLALEADIAAGSAQLNARRKAVLCFSQEEAPGRVWGVLGASTAFATR